MKCFPSTFMWLLLLLLSWIWPPTSCSTSILPCTSVPFPFGFPEGERKSLPGFDVSCFKGVPWLRLGSNIHEITDISLQAGYVKILAGAVWRGFYGASNPIPIGKNQTRSLSYTMQEKEHETLDLEGTPFTFSDKYNKITFIGCDYTVLMRSRPLTSPFTLCFTFCNSPGDVVEGLCQGDCCCQVPLPFGGLKSFELEFGRYMNATLPRVMGWSQAFIVQEHEHTFRKDDLLNISRGLRHTVVLNWAIGNETCQKAKRSNETYACKGNSNCYDSPDGAGFGYLCNCSQGYEGNPYVQGGCKDIDECQHEAINPCVRVAQCINLPGSVTCSCPRGMSGVGWKEGSGCKDNFHLYLALGVGFGLLFILVRLSFWSYWVLKKRNLLKMKEEFFKQNGGLLLEQRLASQGIDATSKCWN